MSKKPSCLMFFREINGADQSKRLKIAGNEGFIPTNHSLRPGSALEERGEKNWSGQKKTSAREASREVVWRGEIILVPRASILLVSGGDDQKDRSSGNENEGKWDL